MAFWPFKKREQGVIRVQFVDAEGEVQFAPCDVPVGQLPESFEASTTMHLGESDWEVVEARPVLASEFRKSGKLVLVMRKVRIETGMPENLLFSLATISDELPGIVAGSSKVGRSTLEMHEDDWRQVEWVSEALMGKVEEALGNIRRIHEEERAGYGFKKVHVRMEVPLPFAGVEVAPGELIGVAGERGTMLEGVSFNKVAGVVQGSFAVRLISSIEVYGLMGAGRVEVMGLLNCRVNNVGEEDVRRLAGFAKRRGLVLVDWCGMEVVEAEEGAYRAFFMG